MNARGTSRTLCLLALTLAACSGAQRTPTVAWHPRSGPSMEQLLNVHRASSPSLSPDGRAVAFLSDAAGLPQAFRVNGDGAAEAQWQRLVTDPERMQFVRYAPDGRWLYLGRDRGGDENTQVLRLAAGTDPVGAPADLTAAPEVKHLFGALSGDGRWLAWASNARSRGDFDVYVRGTDDGATARRVFEAAGHHEVIDFSPDARFVTVLEERSNFDQDVFVVDVNAATARLLTAHAGEGDVRYQAPTFSRDGAALFVVSDRGREFMNLAVLDVTGPTPALPRFVVDEPHDLDLIELSPDGVTLAAVYNLDGWSQLRLYDVHDPAHPTERARPAVPPGVISSLSFSRDGASLAFDLSRAASPDEVFRLRVADGTVDRLTRSDHAGLDETRLVEPSLERVRSFDGEEVPLLLYRPRDLAPGERAPVVVYVHGGPEAQFTPYFNPVIQYLVGHGYIVAAPNVRGSTGYGKRYAHLDDVEHREDSVRDLAAVNQWLRARADVAPSRIAVMGGSYGGYMVLAALTLNPELWAAGCDIVGIANFRTFLERTAAYRRALREAEYGSLARDGELLDRISPIHRVDRIRAPLFVIHGANDPRVPVAEAEQIVAALRQRGQRVEYTRFDNEGHGIFRRENRLRAYGDVVRFFDDVMR